MKEARYIFIGFAIGTAFGAAMMFDLMVFFSR